MRTGLAQRKRARGGANRLLALPTKDQDTRRWPARTKKGRRHRQPPHPKEDKCNRKNDWLVAYFSRRERLATNAIRAARPPM